MHTGKHTMHMNVVLDHGNTSAKIGIFEDDVLKERIAFGKTEDVLAFLANFSGGRIIVSSVNTAIKELPNALRGFPEVVMLTPATPLPLKNKYASAETLGMDRIAAACGAWHLFPYGNSLVIDAGTCITYEFVDSSGAYLGGAISPGLSMRLRAMHTFTARLPLVEPETNPELTGDSTISCMQSGAFWGMVDEIDGAIARYRDKYPDLHVILTGGDAAFFENKLKASIFASPELVLVGLNRILSHNANL